MPPKRAATAAVGKTLEMRRDGAREAAIKELRALRADLATLEAILAGRRKKGDFSLFDVIHGAFEIFRNAATAFDAEEMLVSLAGEIETVTALEFLEKHGATELVKPAGWHWISPRGEMHFLAKPEEAGQAAAKLATLLRGGKRSKRPVKAAAAETADSQPAEPEESGQA